MKLGGGTGRAGASLRLCPGGSRGDARLFIFYLNSSSVAFKKIIIIINPLEGRRKQINISQ